MSRRGNGVSEASGFGLQRTRRARWMLRIGVIYCILSSLSVGAVAGHYFGVHIGVVIAFASFILLFSLMVGAHLLTHLLVRKRDPADGADSRDNERADVDRG